MGTLRTKETQDKYDALRASGGLEGACHLCTAPAIKTFKFWKVINNEFPYDVIAKTHHMIVPLRHTAEAGITQEEWYEWGSLKHGEIDRDYDSLIEETDNAKSIPDHFHIHLIVIKD